jgi:hypothetical protein
MCEAMTDKPQTTFTHAWCNDCAAVVETEFDNLGIPPQNDMKTAADIMGKKCRHVIATVYLEAKCQKQK